MDVSVRSTMKGAAKCDKHRELQNSVNRQGLERILCFWDIPESMPTSVSILWSPAALALSGHAAVITCASRRALALLRHSIYMAVLRQPAKASVLYALVLCCAAASAFSSSLACQAPWT